MFGQANRAALVAALGLVLAATPALAETYLREGSQKIEVVVRDGRLFCTRAGDGYAMCNGMQKTADGAWRGKPMKHPDMPGFMRFNGTVTMSGKALTIKGCAMGMCDSETWSRVEG